MIYEFRTYTTPIGKAPELAKLSAEVGRGIRGDDYGKLVGYWLTDIGPLNQVMHMWSYDDLNHRAERRAALSQNTDWTGTYLPSALPLITRQDIRLMHAAKPVAPPTNDGNVYEYRYYRAKVGKAPQFAQNLKEVLPEREKYSKNVGIWTGEAGQPNEVSHMWAYESPNHRRDARAASMQDPAWQAFLKTVPDLIEEMSSSLLIPWSHSPMK